jgi:death-on-curing protein
MGLVLEIRRMRDYLTAAEIIWLHGALLEKYGGAEGLRDLGALESAAFRPRCGHYGDVVDEAAALMESLLINHPFIDGNKRVAFAACDVFLRMNGRRSSASPSLVHERLMAWLEKAGDRLDLIKRDLRSFVARP